MLNMQGQATRMFRGWNELKVSGKLPERRSYHQGCIYNDYIYIFGGQDLKEGSINTVWRINIRQIVSGIENDKINIETQWDYLKCKGTIPQPMSHHNSFIFNNKMYCYGGLSGI